MYSRTSCKQPPNKLMQRLTGRLQKSNHRGSFLKRGLGTSTLWMIIYCVQFLSYAMCKFRLLIKYMSYIPSSMVHTANIKKRSGRLQEVKNNGKSLNFQAQKAVMVAYRRWSFTRGSDCNALSLSGLVVPYGRWSHIQV